MDQADPSLFFIFHSSMLCYVKYIVLKISLAVMIEIVDLALWAVINSFEIYIINSLIKKNRD